MLSTDDRLRRLLRSRSLHPYRFTARCEIGPFVVANVCAERSLVVELQEQADAHCSASRALRYDGCGPRCGRPDDEEGTMHHSMEISPLLEYRHNNSTVGLDGMLQPRTAVRHDLDSEELGSTALTAFFNITQRWGLSAEEERTLLGAPPRSTFFKWKSERAAKLSADTVERISYVMGIYKALRILLPTAEAAHAWVKKPNAAYGFAGKSALERMLGGRVVDLADVRRYLDAERG